MHLTVFLLNCEGRAAKGISPRSVGPTYRGACPQFIKLLSWNCWFMSHWLKMNELLLPNNASSVTAPKLWVSPNGFQPPTFLESSFWLPLAPETGSLGRKGLSLLGGKLKHKHVIPISQSSILYLTCEMFGYLPRQSACVQGRGAGPDSGAGGHTGSPGRTQSGSCLWRRGWWRHRPAPPGPWGRQRGTGDWAQAPPVSASLTDWWPAVAEGARAYQPL